MSRVETTVSAAANAIVTADSRFQPSTVQKRRWGRSCWKLYSCFGSYKHGSSSKRIGPAGPDPTRPGLVSPVTTNNHNINNNFNENNSSTLIIPFMVPPSSPASFLPSDSPSCPYSPAEFVRAKPSSEPAQQIYAIGPYAHETQLVSPPVFSSAFTTEPSTASYTSPPETVQTTTPSSPEVPFARLLSSSSFAREQRYDDSDDNGCCYFLMSRYEFQPYGQVASDSGTSSPLMSRYELQQCEPYNGNDGEFSYRDCSNQRVSFELDGEDIPVRVLREAVSAHKFSRLRTEDDASCRMGYNDEEIYHYENRTSLSLGSSQGFDFNNANEEEVLEKCGIEGEWSTDEDVVEETLSRSSWSFFPMIRSGIR